jgi:hypothetical protein
VDRPDGAEILPGVARWLMRRSEQPKLRVLVLDRHAEPDNWAADLHCLGLPAIHPNVTRLAGMRSLADRKMLLTHAMTQATRLSGGPLAPPLRTPVLDTGEPLHLLMAGLAAGPRGIAATLAQSPTDLADFFAGRESQRLQRLAATFHLDSAALIHLVACITLRGGAPTSRAHAIAQDEAQAFGWHLPGGAEHVADCLADVLLGTDGASLEPLTPDLVGEAFVIRVLRRYAAEVQTGVIDRALNASQPVATGMIRRMARDHADNEAHPALAWMRQIAP